MNKRAWYLVGLVLLSAACQQAGRITEPYTPDANTLAVEDSTPTRPNPHHKDIP